MNDFEIDKMYQKRVMHSIFDGCNMNVFLSINQLER